MAQGSINQSAKWAYVLAASKDIENRKKNWESYKGLPKCLCNNIYDYFKRKYTVVSKNTTFYIWYKSQNF